MTETQARNILGITSSARRSEAERVYQEKCKKLQLRQVPGMPLTERQQAYQDLIKVTTAWKSLSYSSNSRTRNTRRSKTVQNKKPHSKQKQPMYTHHKPQTLAEAWNIIVQLSPFSEPAMIFIIFITLILVISSFIILH